MSKITRDKSAKFIELAEKRVNRALNDLKLIHRPNQRLTQPSKAF